MLRSFSRSTPGATVLCVPIETHTSGASGSVPLNRSGPTPMTVNVRSLITRDSPMTAASDPKCRRHSVWLMTATALSAPGRSSPGRNARPRERFEAEQRKVVGRDGIPDDVFGIRPADPGRHAHGDVRRQPLEPGSVRPVVEKITIREQVLPPAGLIDGKDADDARGVADGHRAKRERVQQREGDRVDRDADRERQDGGYREGRRAKKGAEGVAKVLKSWWCPLYAGNLVTNCD